MNAIVILFLIGIICLVFEAIMPGAILGILGGAAMITGCVVAFNLYGMSGGALATFIGLLLLGLALYIEFYVLPKTRLGRKMFVHSRNETTSQPPLATDEIIGKQAEALTTLAPSGFVSVDGKRYEAFCRSGMEPQGALLVVSGRDNFRLIVTKKPAQ
ncbi:MAG: NfeD family protein [Opitutaceae bacterium]|jgi:membrane-bound ClpP family serine protease